LKTFGALKFTKVSGDKFAEVNSLPKCLARMAAFTIDALSKMRRNRKIEMFES